MCRSILRSITLVSLLGALSACSNKSPAGTDGPDDDGGQVGPSHRTMQAAFDLTMLNGKMVPFEEIDDACYGPGPEYKMYQHEVERTDGGTIAFGTNGVWIMTGTRSTQCRSDDGRTTPWETEVDSIGGHYVFDGAQGSLYILDWSTTPDGTFTVAGDQLVLDAFPWTYSFKRR